MSHCTTFPMAFRDKRLLFRAMRDTGLEPENQVWNSYSTELQKKLGIGGESLGKLLTGTRDHLNLIILETEEGLQAFVESSELSGEALDLAGGQLLSEVQTAYLRCAVEQACKRYREAGLHAEAHESRTTEGASFVIRFGTGAKSITVTQTVDGLIEESVQGVAGSSCTDATAELERLLADSDVSAFQRTWTPAYQATVEDRELQVLRLTRG
ncbi:DUF2997 domain-containing protein [Fontibacillus sp. BL9]|uniref:DUF2997 domain-containing protein n=1 Tax=Fontibacillus sp. BL9 TaxID=3389971 RepID=UPI00397D9B72